MRTVFYFFLALNLVIFFWPEGAGNGDKKGSTAIPAGVKKLVLVHEAEEEKLRKRQELKLSKEKQKKKKAAKKPSTEKKKTKKKKKTEKTASSQTAVCYALGPFEAESQVKSIAAKLKDLGASTQDRKEKLRSPVGYWVFIPPFKSWNEARQKVMELEKKGMADVFIMGRGRMKNAVSLGLFKKQKAADRRIAELKKLGVKSKSETQYSVSERYWIDVDVEKGKPHVVSAIEAIAKGLTILDLVPRKCN